MIRPAAVGPRLAWRVALAATAVALGLGAPLVVAAAVGDELRYPEVAAVLRGSWIGLSAVIGLYLAHRPRHWHLGLSMIALALMTAVASLDALPGAAAYTASRIVTLPVVLVSLLMLMAIPEARMARARLAAPVALAVPVVLVLAAGYLMVAPTAPWSMAVSQCRGTCAGSAIQVADAPALARGLLAVTVTILVGAMAAFGVVLLRAIRAGSPVTRRTLTPLAWLTAIWAGPVCVGLVAVVIAPGPDRISPYLIVSGAIRAALPVALLAIVIAQSVRTGTVRDQLLSRLSGVTDPTDVERLMAETLRDPSLQLAFRDGAGWIDVAGRPLDVDAETEDRGWIAMSLSGGEAGALTFDPALHTQEERVEAIAALGAAALARVRTEAELRAVRRRLVSVAEEERRRVERSLHDGAQQRLIGMAMRMAMARETLAARPEMALALLRELSDEVQRALDEMRDLAHGLYPPVLVDHGLPAALRSAARHAPVPIDLEIADVGRLDPLQEAAVYFCCAEALQNAVKHGGRDVSIGVRLWRDDGALAFEVADDGPGYVVGPLPAGSGLVGMRDRVEGVDGTLTIDSAPGRGTRVSGRIPMGPAVVDGTRAAP